MEASFYQSSKFSNEKLRDLSVRKDSLGFVRFIIVLFLFLLMNVWVIFAWESTWWNLIVSQIVFGVMVCSVFAGLHETGHGTVFASKKLNRLAAFLFGVAHLYPAGLFRELHFTHHRYTHIPGKDPEISLGNRAIPSVISSLPSYLGWLTGLPLLLFKILMLITGAFGMPEFLRETLFPFVNPKKRMRLALESIFVLLVYVVLIFLALSVNSAFWSIFIGQVVGHLFLANYLIMEHNGLPHRGNILEKTRSIKTPKIIKLLMWNMPYHAEHHAYPSVPFYSLPKLHEELKDEIKHKDEGYFAFHLKTIKSLFSVKKEN